MRLGILRNPASTGNLGRPAPALPDGAVMAGTAGPRDCAAALARLADAGAGLIVVDGGDGTIRDAISRFPAVFGDDWPPVAVLAHGNTNLAARRLGAVRASDLPRLAAMSSGELARHLAPAPVLRIAVAGHEEPLHGFIAGWGAYAAATRIGREEITARHGAQIIAAAAATLRRTLAGREAAALRRGVDAAVHAEGHPQVHGRRFLGIATALPGRLIGPLSPFWGSGDGPVRWLDIAAPPYRLGLAAPFVAFGRPAGWMLRAGYRSGRTARLDLALAPGEAGLVLDGEAIGGEDGLTATITADETLRWLDLRRPALSTRNPGRG